jgi:hypothetical protein
MSQVDQDLIFERKKNSICAIRGLSRGVFWMLSAPEIGLIGILCPLKCVY